MNLACRSRNRNTEKTAVRPRTRRWETTDVTEHTDPAGAIKCVERMRGVGLILKACLLRTREQIADRRAKTRQDVFTIECAALGEPTERSIRTVDSHRPSLGIDHPDQTHAGDQILRDLFLKLEQQVVRRADFDRQVRRDSNIA